ncbi:MAG: hypothetical protein AABY09_00775, partial [Nanoarchaeota archaeon]
TIQYSTDSGTSWTTMASGYGRRTEVNYTARMPLDIVVPSAGSNVTGIFIPKIANITKLKFSVMRTSATDTPLAIDAGLDTDNETLFSSMERYKEYEFSNISNLSNYLSKMCTESIDANCSLPIRLMSTAAVALTVNISNLEIEWTNYYLNASSLQDDNYLIRIIPYDEFVRGTANPSGANFTIGTETTTPPLEKIVVGSTQGGSTSEQEIPTDKISDIDIKPKVVQELKSESEVIQPKDIAQQIIEEIGKELGELSGVAKAIMQSMPPPETLPVQGKAKNHGVELTIGKEAVMVMYHMPDEKPEIKTDFKMDITGLAAAEYSEPSDIRYTVPAYAILALLILAIVNLAFSILKGMPLFDRMGMKNAAIVALEQNLSNVGAYSTIALYEKSMYTFIEFLSVYLKVNAKKWGEVSMKLGSMGTDSTTIEELEAVYKRYIQKIERRTVSRKELVTLIIKLKYIIKNI